MIYVDRGRVPEPVILRSPQATKARAQAKSYFVKVRSKRLQRRFPFLEGVWEGARTALGSLFHNKCAFCESRKWSVGIDHFRPKVEAIGLQGELAPDGYWWLAYEWENLYLMCPECSRNKGNRFPVAGPRARPPDKGPRLSKEKALLLDPCVDRPEEFLAFDLSGKALSRKPRRGPNRGQITIETFELNRSLLVKQRRAEVLRRAQEWRTLRSLSHSRAVDLVKRWLDPAHEFAGLRKQMLTEWPFKYRIPERVRSTLLEAIIAVSPSLEKRLTEMERKFRLAPRKRRRVSRKTPVPKQAAPVSRATRELRKAAYLQEIEIKNLKAIRHLRIPVPTGDSERVGWKVLLGENGTGKSTVLQAVALTLMGEDFVKSNLRLDPMFLLRKSRGGRRASEGFVKLRFTRYEIPLEMRFSRKGFEWKNAAAAPRPFLRAYGATRLLPRFGQKVSLGGTAQRQRAENLFRPQVPVIDASRFLGMVRSKKFFGSAALSLKDLLQIPMRARIGRKRHRVFVPLHGIPFRLEEFSDGYQAVVVLATDIMAGVLGTVSDLRHAEGIVLIDEIDAHLHPRWKMEIVRSLRRTFPRMQFLMTTHEPLCLRGLEDKEIMVFRREKASIRILDEELPSAKGLRVDQLLTSPYFGLHSTIDPEDDKMFRRYYALLAKSSLTDSEKVEKQHLSLQITPKGMLGDNRRDQLIYETIDRYLAKGLDLKADETVRDDTRKEVASLWKNVLALGERPQ